MNKFFRKIAVVVLYLHWPVLLVFALSTLFFTYSLSLLKIDPSTETLLAKNTSEYRFYRDFRKHFGSDSLLAIAIRTSNYLTLPHLRLTHVLTQTLSSDARVDRVMSLTNVLDVRHKMFGVKVEPLIKGVFEGDKPFEEFREEALAHPFVQGNLLSRNGEVGAVLIRLKISRDDPSFLRGYVSELREFLRAFPWPGAEFYIAGSPVEQHDFVDEIRKDQMFFIPAVSLFLILATFFIYRNWANVFVAMSIVFVTLIWTFGTIALLGRSLNLVNSLLAPIVMIISITSAIHLINLFSELRPHHSSLRECICLTLEHLGVPCLLTAATTMAGFLSLLLNPVPAVQGFGFFASLGTFYSFFVVMTLTPALLPFLPFQRQSREERERHFFNRAIVFYLEKIEFHLKWPLLLLTLVLLAASVYGIRKIRVDTNLINDLPAGSPLGLATRFIDQNLAGVYSLGLSIKRRDDQPLVTVDTLKRLDALDTFLEAQPEITKINSLAPLIKKIHEAREGEAEAFRIPEEEETLQTYLNGMAEKENPDFWSFVSRDFDQLRIEGRMKAVGTRRGRELENRIQAYLPEHWPPEYDIQITGNAVLLGHMSERLVVNLLQSLGLAFFVILSLISLFFRSWKMGGLASIPNLLPILWLYGLIGFLGIELSTPIAMISSVALGLVVDASIHFLHRFRFEFRHRGHYLQSLHHTYRNVGQALVVATLILVFGFATSVFSSLRPTFFFGILTSLTILFALTCTLVLLPLVLILFKPFGRESLFKHPSKEVLTPSERSSILSP